MNANLRRESPASLADAVQQVARAAVDSGDVPGVVAQVWHRGRLRCEAVAGLRDIERSVALDRATIFGIASMSKPVTVALALTLVDAGRLRLDEPIARWAPEFAAMRVLRRPDAALDDTVPAARLITVEDLMTHRSGLAYGFMTPPPLGTELMARLGMGLSGALAPDEWLKALAELPLVYQPGERFNYGVSIDVLGFIVARLLDTDLRTAMRGRLLFPAGMFDTDFWVAPEKRERLARFYTSTLPGEFVATEVESLIAGHATTCALGGQGLVTTADDYLRFARLLMQGELDGVRVLESRTVRRMRSNCYSAAQRQQPYFGQPFTQGVGQGLWVTTDPEQPGALGGMGSFGWPGAFGGWWLADPQEDLILLWLQQCAPAPPGPGGPMPRIPGTQSVRQFREAVYRTLRNGE